MARRRSWQDQRDRQHPSRQDDQNAQTKLRELIIPEATRNDVGIVRRGVTHRPPAVGPVTLVRVRVTDTTLTRRRCLRRLGMRRRSTSRGSRPGHDSVMRRHSVGGQQDDLHQEKPQQRHRKRDKRGSAALPGDELLHGRQPSRAAANWRTHFALSHTKNHDPANLSHTHCERVITYCDQTGNGRRLPS